MKETQFQQTKFYYWIYEEFMKPYLLGKETAEILF